MSLTLSWIFYVSSVFFLVIITFIVAHSNVDQPLTDCMQCCWRCHALSLFLRHTLHSIEMFLKSTWWWWKFYINFPLFHFSSIVVYIAMRTSECGLKKHILSLSQERWKYETKIPNLWIVFPTFSLEFSSLVWLSDGIFLWKKHFLHHYEFASHLITKNCIILKPTTSFTLQRYPIKLFAIYPT